MFAISIGMSSIACELSGGAIWAVILAFQDPSLPRIAPLKTHGQFLYGAFAKAVPHAVRFQLNADREEV
jgi:hypothetical protein